MISPRVLLAALLAALAAPQQRPAGAQVLLGAQTREFAVLARAPADWAQAAASSGDWPAAAPLWGPGAAPAGRGRRSTDPQPVYTNQFVMRVRGGEPAARRLASKHGFTYLNHVLGDLHHLEHRRLQRRSLDGRAGQALNASIQDEPQVLMLERQLLRRRVKRDYLPDGRRPEAGPSSPAAPGRRPGPGQPSAALLRPANQARGPQAGRARQFGQARPANQAPAEPEPLASQPASLYQPPMQAAFGRARRPPPGPLAANASSPLAAAYLAAAAAASASAPAAASSSAPTSAWPTSGAPNGPPTANESRRAHFTDPSWPLMWYLDGGAKNGFDLNVLDAWRMGYTGKGVVVTILDDGLEHNHPDLKANYDPLASYDINGADPDPMPRYDHENNNKHGTRCAGEVAAVADNNICALGIAYNSRVGGVRMLDGDVTDAVEARALSMNNQHIHVYSASWGPDDSGASVDGPGELATRAFIEGVTYGRQGLGSIFVFASGNGGHRHDNCNCDGYTNSIWTLSISSATENGYVPWFIEPCSSTLATTYSSGSSDERQIVTTDLHHSCTSTHTGTSASAPLAAGICALVLESNPRLTWRDMQHIVVRTAKPANLIARDWRLNALGRNVSHAFGYGLMDASAMISMAREWHTVATQYTCEVDAPQLDKPIPPKGYIELKLRVECVNVRHLEHVQSKVTLSATRRGELHIYLVSPQGTRSMLLAQRPNDHTDQGFRNWPFMTVHSWGESPKGVWTLEVHNDGKQQSRAQLKAWTLILYGTKDDPNRHLTGRPTHLEPMRQPHWPSTALGPVHSPSAASPPPPPPPPPPLAPFVQQTSSRPASPQPAVPPPVSMGPTIPTTTTPTTSTTSTSTTTTTTTTTTTQPSTTPTATSQNTTTTTAQPAPVPTLSASLPPPPPPPVSIVPTTTSSVMQSDPKTTVSSTLEAPGTRKPADFEVYMASPVQPQVPVSVKPGPFANHSQSDAGASEQTTVAPAMSPLPPMKPAVGETPAEPELGVNTPPPALAGNELEAVSQLDSKLGKDYRSLELAELDARRLPDPSEPGGGTGANLIAAAAKQNSALSAHQPAWQPGAGAALSALLVIALAW